MIFAAVSPLLRADERVEKLTAQDRKWLTEEVVYIIHEREREVFLSLETIEERARFKDAFWRRRDPEPATAANEFQEEHYRRIDYANQFLGRETNREGWQTDRGRFYIILGEPREIQRFDSDNDLVESELWFYQGDTSRGVPAFFYLLFFKRKDVGEYRLYHPLADGPTALLRSTQGMAGAANATAVERLQRISPELARASLSVGTRESVDFLGGNAGLGVGMTLARIEESAKRAVRTDYADAHMRYRDRVTADYSFNFVPSRSYFAVLVGPERTPFLHYSVELDAKDFSLETDESQTRFYTTLDVTLEVREREGKVLIVNEKSLPVELTRSQVGRIGTDPIAYQDDFPLVPGPVTVSVVLRNRVLRQYTVAETELEVDDFSTGKPMLSDLILGFGHESTPEAASGDAHRTFQIGGASIAVASGATFVLGDMVYLFGQAVDAGADHRLRFTLSGGDDAPKQWETALAHFDGGPFLEEIPLRGKSGGVYEVKVQLLDSSGKEMAQRTGSFVVSPRTALARPGFVYRRSFNPDIPGLLPLVRGEQLWALGRRDDAVRDFETAVAAGNPELPMARWKLAGARIQSGNPDGALELLLPLETSHPLQYEVVAGLGFAFHQKGDFARAVDYLGRAASIRPPDTGHWNALGDSYRRVGDAEKAKEAFERSLKLDPDQPKVKEQLRKLGRR